MHPQNTATLKDIVRVNRELDPIAVVQEEAKPIDSDAMTHDIGKIDHILLTDRTLRFEEITQLYREGVDLRLDRIYTNDALGTPLRDRVTYLKEAIAFSEAAQQHLDDRKATPLDHPQERWAVQIKMLDLQAYTAYAFAKDAETTLKNTAEGEKLFGLAESQLKTVLFSSLRLMNEMSRAATSRVNEKLASDARGSLYEALLVAYSRLKTYEAQTIDRVFTRSALTREDKPHNNYVNPKRSFDLAISTDGIARLIQAKNHLNHEDYAPPIEKIYDPQYHKTLDRLPTLIDDFRIALENNPHPSMKNRTDVAYSRLENVFGRHLEPTAVVDIRD